MSAGSKKEALPGPLICSRCGGWKEDMKHGICDSCGSILCDSCTYAMKAWVKRRKDPSFSYPTLCCVFGVYQSEVTYIVELGFEKLPLLINKKWVDPRTQDFIREGLSKGKMPTPKWDGLIQVPGKARILSLK